MFIIIVECAQNLVPIGRVFSYSAPSYMRSISTRIFISTTRCCRSLRMRLCMCLPTFLQPRSVIFQIFFFAPILFVACILQKEPSARFFFYLYVSDYRSVKIVLPKKLYNSKNKRPHSFCICSGKKFCIRVAFALVARKKIDVNSPLADRSFESSACQRIDRCASLRSAFFHFFGRRNLTSKQWATKALICRRSSRSKRQSHRAAIRFVSGDFRFLFFKRWLFLFLVERWQQWRWRRLRSGGGSTCTPRVLLQKALRFEFQQDYFSYQAGGGASGGGSSGGGSSGGGSCGGSSGGGGGGELQNFYARILRLPTLNLQAPLQPVATWLRNKRASAQRRAFRLF